MISERPILGWGPIENQFEIGARIGEEKKDRRDAHNIVLDLMTSTGFLGAIPLGIEVREGGDCGVPVVISQPESPQSVAFRKVAEEVARQVSIEAMKPELVVLGKGQ